MTLRSSGTPDPELVSGAQHAERERVSRPTATTVIQRLEQEGLALAITSVFVAPVLTRRLGLIPTLLTTLGLRGRAQLLVVERVQGRDDLLDLLPAEAREAIDLGGDVAGEEGHGES